VTQYLIHQIDGTVTGLPPTRFSTVDGAKEHGWEWVATAHTVPVSPMAISSQCPLTRAAWHTVRRCVHCRWVEDGAAEGHAKIKVLGVESEEEPSQVGRRRAISRSERA
jgi:hypothetical protein